MWFQRNYSAHGSNPYLTQIASKDVYIMTIPKKIEIRNNHK